MLFISCKTGLVNLEDKKKFKRTKLLKRTLSLLCTIYLILSLYLKITNTGLRPIYCYEYIFYSTFSYIKQIEQNF